MPQHVPSLSLLELFHHHQHHMTFAQNISEFMFLDKCYNCNKVNQSKCLWDSGYWSLSFCLSWLKWFWPILAVSNFGHHKALVAVVVSNVVVVFHFTLTWCRFDWLFFYFSFSFQCSCGAVKRPSFKSCFKLAHLLL